MDRAIGEGLRARGAWLWAAMAAVCLVPAVAFAQVQAPVQLDPGEAPPPPSSGSSSAPVPLSWNDPIFANVKNVALGQVYSGCKTVSDISIQDYSGGVEAAVKGGCFTLNTSRLRSRENFRAAGSIGGDSGDITLNWVYSEVTSQPGDHADGLQCYGSGGNIYVNHSTFWMTRNSDTTGGFYCSANWNGDLHLTDVLFYGAGYGLRADNPRSGCLYLNNVYFVQGSFGYAPFYIDGCISEWNNVHWVTIQNGQLVIGNAIPKP